MHTNCLFYDTLQYLWHTSSCLENSLYKVCLRQKQFCKPKLSKLEYLWELYHAFNPIYQVRVDHQYKLCFCWIPTLWDAKIPPIWIFFEKKGVFYTGFKTVTTKIVSIWDYQPTIRPRRQDIRKVDEFVTYMI